MEVKTRKRVKMTIEMEVTKPQGLALQAMFEYWNYLAGIGASRQISFMVDGDGNFHPDCKVSFDEEMPEMNDELRELAVVEDVNRARKYDFDAIAWKINK
jgi:hypothetical protein